MAYIRNVSELPKWFNLDNYRFNLPANDLLQLFIIRFTILDLLLDDVDISWALLHKDLKCKAPLIEPNLRRNLGKWST